MDPHDIKIWVEAVGVSLAAAIAFMTIIRLTYFGVIKISEIRLRFEQRRRIRGMIIKPNSDEISKYSVKLPQRLEPEEIAIWREAKITAKAMFSKDHIALNSIKRRNLMLLIAMMMAIWVFVARMWQWSN